MFTPSQFYNLDLITLNEHYIWNLTIYFKGNRKTSAQFENQAWDVYKAWYYVWKSSILLAGTRVRKYSTVACGSSLIKINYFDYPKCFINRINKVMIFWKSINFIFCNDTCYSVGMVSVMSASRYVTSASHQSRSSMYIRGLIPRYWPRQFWLISKCACNFLR